MKPFSFALPFWTGGSWLTALLLAISCGAATPDLASSRSVRDLRLKVSANGRHFVDQHGKPFFYLGDTCWLLFQRPSREELDEYLEDRVAKGFTVMQAYVVRGLGQQHPDGNASLLEATPFLDRDPTRPNEAFFQHVDYVVNRANELGLVLGLVTAKSWHVADHPEKIFNEQNAYTLVPDQSVLASEAGVGPYRLVAGRAEDGGFVVAYTPRGQALSIHMNKLATARVKARWFDPRAGNWRGIGVLGNTGDQPFAPPSHGPTDDWVLVLDATP